MWFTYSTPITPPTHTHTQEKKDPKLSHTGRAYSNKVNQFGESRLDCTLTQATVMSLSLFLSLTYTHRQGRESGTI